MLISSSIFLAGASRGVGQEIAKYLIAQQIQVKALLRTEAAAMAAKAMGVYPILGDALNVTDIEQAI